MDEGKTKHGKVVSLQAISRNWIEQETKSLLTELDEYVIDPSNNVDDSLFNERYNKLYSRAMAFQSFYEEDPYDGIWKDIDAISSKICDIYGKEFL